MKKWNLIIDVDNCNNCHMCTLATKDEYVGNNFPGYSAEMPKRGRGNSPKNKAALLHALAHIELNAIDLACDLISRFANPLFPREFYDDWVRIAKEEATHFVLLTERLAQLGTFYGDLPAHDGLWEAAESAAFFAGFAVRRTDRARSARVSIVFLQL